MHAVEILLLSLALCGVAYHVVSTGCGLALLRRRPISRPEPSSWPGITLLKPLRGVDEHAYECLASFCRQDYPDYQIVFGVLDAADPAIPLVGRLQEGFPAADIRLVVGSRRGGINLKVANLANMLPEARHPLLVICDSDMRVEAGYLRAIASEFQDPRVGLATCPYRGAEIASPAAALEALGIATDFLPGVLLVACLGRPDFAFGSTIALSASVLSEIGGFEAIRDYLADDFQLGHRVAQTGRRVVISPYVVENVIGATAWRAVIERRIRWARTVRVCRPAGHAASVITQGAAFALAFLFASGFSPTGWALLGLQQVVRGASGWLLAVHGLGNRELRRWFWLLPVADVMSAVAWLASWSGSRIRWRGVDFRVLPDGRLVPLDGSAGAPEPPGPG